MTPGSFCYLRRWYSRIHLPQYNMASLGLSCSDIKYASLWSPSRGYSSLIAAGVRTWSHYALGTEEAVAGGAFFLIAPA